LGCTGGRPDGIRSEKAAKRPLIFGDDSPSFRKEGEKIFEEVWERETGISMSSSLVLAKKE
jgi:hypothetical protein